MNPTPADIVAAARMRVYTRHPYLSHVLFSLRPHSAPGLGTMATDEHWRMFYDPEVVTRWNEESLDKAHDGVASVIFHELGHVLREHFRRRVDRDPILWNIAGDMEINDDVIAAGWKLPAEPCLPEHIGKPDGLLAEDYYQSAQENAQKQYPVCGGCAGNPTQWEKDHAGPDARGEPSGAPGGESSDSPPSSSPMPSPADANEQEIVLRRTAMDIAEHVKKHGKGSIPAGMQAWATMRLTPPKVDWRKKLAGMTRQALASVAGACDFTWRRIGRRALHSAGRAGWPLAPALHQPSPRVAVVLDTSGSMSCANKDGRTILEEALSEIVGIAKACGADLWGVACDADVEAIARIGNVQDLRRLNKGGGGTDMRPGFKAAKKTRPDIVVIVTDGYVGSNWPGAEDCRGVRVMAAIVGGTRQATPSHIPSIEVGS